MKNKIFIALSLVSLQTFASDATDFCLSFSASRNECLEIIKGGTFQDDALKLCEDWIDPKKSLNCLKAIKNAMIESEAIEVCDSFAVESNRIKCIEASKNKLMREKDIMACDRKSEVSDVISCLNRL